MFFIEIWNDFLYRPLFNFLIWIYNNWTDQNMGWSIVYLTIIIRMVLLPFSILNAYSNEKNADLFDEIERIENEFKNDPILRKEEVRRAMKKRKVYPWSKALVLGIQAVALLVLYQVFIGGLAGKKVIEQLYTFVSIPGTINTDFYGFTLTEPHNIIWPGAIAIIMFLQIYLGYRKTGVSQKSDLTYAIIFPLAIFVVMWWLPMVKSLFILTTILFSMIVNFFIRLVMMKDDKKDNKKKEKNKKDGQKSKDKS